MIDETDFKLLLLAVKIMHNNMALNYDAFRHTAELRQIAKILDKLTLKYPLERIPFIDKIDDNENGW
jgi:hypothetical protein